MALLWIMSYVMLDHAFIILKSGGPLNKWVVPTVLH